MTTREYAKNLFSAWSDEDFCNQPIFDKLLFQVLNGQRAVNLAGIQPINFTRWRKAMRDGDRLPPVRELQAALVRMERRGYVYTDEDTGELLIRTRIRNDGLDKQPNQFLSALRLLAVIDSPKFAAVMAVELEHMVTPEIKGDTDQAKRLRENLNKASLDARCHLKALSEEIPEPFPEPFTEDFPEGLSEGFTEPFPRPAEIETPREPFPEPFRDGSVSGSVSVSTSPPVDGDLGGTRARASQAADDGSSQPAPVRNEPPRRCKAHATSDDVETDCGPCANFRKAHDRWTAQQARARAQAASDDAHAKAALQAEAIHACQLCGPDGYRLASPTQVCDHHDRTDTTRRGIAACRAATARKLAAVPEPPEADGDA